MKFSTCTIASFGSTIRKYATAFTRTGTLSFVITSCGGMFSVIVRRSTLDHPVDDRDQDEEARALRLGQQAAEPEDDPALVLARHLDRRDQRTAGAGRRRSAKMIEGGSHGSQPSSLGAHGQREAVQGLDLRPARPRASAAVGLGVPELAVDEHEPAVAHDPLHADDLLRPDLRRPAPHAIAFEIANAQSAPSRTVIVITSGSEVWYGAGSVVEERDHADATLQRGPTDRQRAVASRTCSVDHEQRDAEQDEREARPGERQHGEAEERGDHADRAEGAGDDDARDGRARSRARRGRRGRAARRCSGRSGSRGSG